MNGLVVLDVYMVCVLDQELYISFTCLSLVTRGCIVQSQLHTSNGRERANLVLTSYPATRWAGWLPSVWL